MAVNQKLIPETTKVKTGILQSYSGTLAQVAIDGNVLNLPMLDTIGTPAVGSTVVCQVYGSTGYVIGSLNTNSRAASATWPGGYANPPVPNPSVPNASYSTFVPTQAGQYIDASGNNTSVSITGGQFSQNGVTADGGSWYYGSSAFISLTGKTILSVDVYLPGLAGGNYPLNIGWHTSATRPSVGGQALFDFTLRSTSGWVSLPAPFATALSTRLTAFGVGIYGNVASIPFATISAANPYGTLRIGWK